LEEKTELAIIVCKEPCPVIYARHVEDRSVPDPVEIPLKEARKVRDEIKNKISEPIERIRHESHKERFQPQPFP
ncbi:hypothetical protein KEJ36_02895, partial [Candidatus Bathyarchaeota archaeon]|nr:hypothetical protein [Candidatus Bathyarchaeota archaeon]